MTSVVVTCQVRHSSIRGAIPRQKAWTQHTSSCLVAGPCQRGPSQAAAPAHLQATVCEMRCPSPTPPPLGGSSEPHSPRPSSSCGCVAVLLTMPQWILCTKTAPAQGRSSGGGRSGKRLLASAGRQCSCLTCIMLYPHTRHSCTLNA